MSEDQNDKSTKKASETSSSASKSPTTKSTTSTSKATSSAKSEAAKTGTVETAAEQTGSKSTASSGKSTTSSTGTASSQSSSTSDKADAGKASTSSASAGSEELSLGSSGLPRHFAAGLSYILGPITGIIFLLLDRADPFVRFHAAQSVAISVVIAVVWIGVAVLSAVFAGMPLVFWLGFLCLLYMAFTAFQSKDWELPMLGEYAQQLSDKVAPAEEEAK